MTHHPDDKKIRSLVDLWTWFTLQNSIGAVLGLSLAAYWISDDVLLQGVSKGDRAYLAQEYEAAEKSFANVIWAESWLPWPLVDTRLDAQHGLALTYVATDRISEAAPILQSVVDARKTREGPSHPNTLRDMQNLATVYRELDQNGSALPLLRAVFEARRDALGVDNERTILAMQGLAISLNLLGQYEEALDLQTQILNVQRATLAPDDPGLRFIIQDVVATLLDLGRKEDALQLYPELLSLRRKDLGETHPITIGSMDAMATLYKSINQPETALPLALEALELSQNTFGPAAPDTRVALTNAAKTYNALGRYADAAPLFQKSFDSSLSGGGPDSRETIEAQLNLAMVQNLLGAHEVAVSLGHHAYKMARKTLGDDDETTLILANNLANFLADVGRYQEALAVSEEVVLARRVALGPQHPETLKAMNNLASLYFEMERFDESLEITQDVLETRRSVLGPDHPDTLVSIVNLAIMYRFLGRIPQALELSQNAVELSGRIHGDAHEFTLTALRGLSLSLKLADRTVEAFDVMQNVLDVTKAQYGSRHPATVRAMITLSDLHSQLSREGSALALRQEALEINRAARGHAHPMSLRLVRLLGQSLIQEGRYAEAQNLLSGALEPHIANYGSKHASTADLQNSLAVALLFDGHPVSALAPSRAALEGRLARAAAFEETVLDGRSGDRDTLRSGIALLATSAWQASQAGSTQGADPALSAHPSNQPDALRDEAFEAMQHNTRGAASALTQAAGRIAAGAQGLEPIVRDWEAARAELAALDLLRSEFLQSPIEDAQSAAAWSQANDAKRAAASTRLRRTERVLETQFPDFFDLVAPTTVAVSELQGADGLLGADEVLLALLPPSNDTPGFVWAVTQDDIAWAEMDIDAETLFSMVSQLHEQLDLSNSTRGAFNLDGPSDTQARLGFDMALAHDLYDALLGQPDIQALVSEKLSWIMAPQGVLLSLPFATLVVDAPPPNSTDVSDPQALRAATWLGLERAISVVPAVSSIRVLRGRDPSDAPAGGQFFGVGDPQFSPEPKSPGETLLAAASEYYRGTVGNPDSLSRLAALPGTRREIQRLAQMFRTQDDTQRVLLGPHANEQNLYAANDSGVLRASGVVVFATHGLMAGAFDGLAEPALALTPPPCGPKLVGEAPPDRAHDAQNADSADCHDTIPLSDLTNAARLGERIDDGLLTASEAARLSLSSGWVVLSACDTAAGRDQSPDAEGLSGLARAFFYAGAQSLLVSHWPVRDDVAARLTPDAIARAEQKTSRAEAFRQAMRALVADTSQDSQSISFAHPALWAPFQVTGIDAVAK